MSLSPILAVTQLITAQSNKDVTVNDAIRALERSRAFISKSVAGTGTIVLTPDEARHGVIEATGALTGNRTIEVPTGMTNSVVILNNTTGAFTLDAKYTTTTAIRVPRGCAVPIRPNGAAAAYDFRAGAVKLPEVIAFRNSTGQTATNNAETVVQFNGESRDTSEAWDSTTNWRFTVPATGLYNVKATVEVDVTGSPAGNYNGHAAIRVAGSVVRRGDQTITGTQGAGTTTRHTVSGIMQLTQGDLLDIVFSNGHSAGTLTIDAGIEKTNVEIFCLRLGT